MKEEFVYFIQFQNYLKIGYSTNPAERVSKMATAFPEVPLILSVIKGDRHLERYFHKKFKLYRTNREWFLIEGILRDFLISKACLVVPTTNQTFEFGGTVVIRKGPLAGTIGTMVGHDKSTHGNYIVRPIKRADMDASISVPYGLLDEIELLSVTESDVASCETLTKIEQIVDQDERSFVHIQYEK